MTKKVLYRSDVHQTNQVFFDPCGDQYGLMIHDTVLSNGVGHYGGKTLEEYRQTNPLMMIVDWKQAAEWIRDYHRTEPQEITENQFLNMLEVLPPVDWKSGVLDESFKMLERLTLNITGIYARIGQRYFSFYDVDNLEHFEIIDKVKASQAYKAKQ